MKNKAWATAISVFLVFLVAACTNDANMGHNMSGMGDITTTPLATAVDYDAVYVVNGGDHSLSVIDVSTDQVTGTIGMKNVEFPHHVYLSPDGAKLAIGVPGEDFSTGHAGGMMEGMGAVIVLDARTGALLMSRRMMSMNHNATFDPTGDEIWTCGMMDAGMLYMLDAMTLTVKDSIAVGNTPQEVTFAPGGRYAFVCNGGSNNVTVIDRTTRQVVKTIDVGKNPVGAWPGSNGIMYVDNEESKTISAIDTATLTVLLTYNLGFTPGMAACGPNNELWITDSDSGRVVINGTELDSVLAICNTGAGAHGIVFSGDTTKAYVTNQLSSTVTVVDARTRLVLRSITVGSKPNGLAWRKN